MQSLFVIFSIMYRFYHLSRNVRITKVKQFLYFFRMKVYKVPDKLQVVITDNDVDEILSIEVKELNKDTWEVIQKQPVKIDNSLLIEIDSHGGKSLDLRILASRKNKDELQYLMFMKENLEVLCKLKLSFITRVRRQNVVL